MKPHSVKVALRLLAALAITSLHAQAIFYDDFESYAPGSDLTGQGGWYLRLAGQAPIIVSAGSGLGSKVVNGGIRTGDRSYTDPNQPYLLHSLPGALSSGGVSTLSADAYAFSSYRSHATGVGLISPDLSQMFIWFALWYGAPRETPQWSFQVTGLGYVGTFYGGFDEPVRLEVVIDGSAGEAYGRLHHSGGTFETAHTAITLAQISALTDIALIEDYRDRFYLGAEYDNITVVVPEPAGGLLFLLVAGAYVFWRRHRVA